MEELVYRYGNQIELRDDFYSVTFIAFVYLDDPNEIYGLEDEDELRGKVLSQGEVQRCFMNCLLIFFMQVILTISFLFNFNDEDKNKVFENF